MTLKHPPCLGHLCREQGRKHEARLRRLNRVAGRLPVNWTRRFLL